MNEEKKEKEAQRLEKRATPVAGKKPPVPPPYPPGTDYGLIQKGNLLYYQRLEKRTAPSGKKQPVPPPYPPGTRYGLVKRTLLLW